MWQIAEGSPSPLGVHRAGERLNFAVYSKNARAMELVLYERDDWVTPALLNLGTVPSWRSRRGPDTALTGFAATAHR